MAAETPEIVRRLVAWTKPDPIGAEVAAVTLERDQLSAVGTAIGSDPVPYRLDYELTTGAGFITRLVRVTVTGEGWTRHLELHHDGRGNWGAETSGTGAAPLPEPGGDVSQFKGAIDPDLGLSPLFNTMPVLRHRLLDADSRADDFLMVWISVPDLQLHLSPQRYTHVREAGATPAVVLFESVGEGEDFREEIQFDTDGLVIDYPQIATRIRPAEVNA
jgi:uncharacterized protein